MWQKILTAFLSRASQMTPGAHRGQQLIEFLTGAIKPPMYDPKTVLKAIEELAKKSKGV